MSNSDSIAARALVEATVRLAEAGKPLMERVAPADGGFVVWEHYPPDDAVDRRSGCRWFYHAHPPGEREEGEHGHFHLFFDRDILRCRKAKPLAGPLGGASSGADVVHIAAISIDLMGLPRRLFTVNRWVTDEWLYPATAITPLLPRFDLTHADGDLLVNRWLTATVRFFAPRIVRILTERDMLTSDWLEASRYEDRSIEVLSAVPIDINDALEA